MVNFTILFAYLVDLIIGDPSNIPHPVVLIGKLISKLEKIFYSEKYEDSKKLILGGILVIIVLFVTFSFTWGIVFIANKISSVLGFMVSVWLISTTIAVKGLKDVGLEIKNLLDNKNLKEARVKVGYIVGRDTENLDEKEVTRATVETIAENIVDAIISPLIYAFLGGAPLAMTYRAVNTLDSMLGYKNDKYLYFGRVSARVDDVFNFIPARLTGLSIALISFIIPGLSGINSLKIMLRDARKHPSPNSGFSESSVAGSLFIRLGGENSYFGKKSLRPYMGDDIKPLSAEIIGKTILIMYAVSFVWVLSLVMLKYHF